jgi:hypothetical protein
LPVGSSARISAGSVTRPGDRDALLLAAGQLGRLVVDAIAEPEPLERRAGASDAVAPSDALVEEGSRDVVERVVRGSRL